MSHNKYDYLGYRHIARWYHDKETTPRECGGHFVRTAEHIGDDLRECLKCDGCLHVTHRYWEISETLASRADKAHMVREAAEDRKLHVELEHVSYIFAKKIMSEGYDLDDPAFIDLQEIKNLIVHLQNYIEYKEQKQEIANLEKKLAEIRRE